MIRRTKFVKQTLIESEISVPAGVDIPRIHIHISERKPEWAIGRAWLRKNDRGKIVADFAMGQLQIASAIRKNGKLHSGHPAESCPTASVDVKQKNLNSGVRKTRLCFRPKRQLFAECLFGGNV